MSRIDELIAKYCPRWHTKCSALGDMAKTRLFEVTVRRRATDGFLRRREFTIGQIVQERLLGILDRGPALLDFVSEICTEWETT